jgi:ABC-type sugar transport system permease subunit
VANKTALLEISLTNAPKKRWSENQNRLDLPMRRFRRIVLVPTIVYLLVFTAFPIIWVLILSVFKYSPRREGSGLGGLGGDNPFVGLANFVELFNFIDPSTQATIFQTALMTTLIFAFIVLPLNLAITLPLAAMIESTARRISPVFRTFFFLPVVTSAAAVAVIWAYVLNPQYGLLNSVLTQASGELVFVAWLNDSTLSFLGVPIALLAVIFAYLWMDIGFNLIIFIAAIQGIPKVLYEAAEVDGVTAWQRFRFITVPLMMPAIAIASILTMISSFQAFDLFQVLTKGGPNRQTQVLSLDIFQNAFRFESMGLAAAEALVLLFIVIVIAIAQSRLLRSKWSY